jgi:hypothetical protein
MRQWLNCPTTEAHGRHLATLKALPTLDAQRDFVAQLSRAESRFLANWVRDDFLSWRAQAQAKTATKTTTTKERQPA